MAKYQILYWQEIPSLVEAREGRARHKEQLSQRFQELIDRVAMRIGMAGTDAYLEQWNKGPAIERAGDAQAVVRAISAELEAQYEDIETRAMAEAAQARKQTGS